jgi:hypothetical protein
MPVPALLDRLRAARRLDARRRLNALAERSLATRGTPEAVQAAQDRLADAAGVVPDDGGGFAGLAAALGAGGRK